MNGSTCVDGPCTSYAACLFQFSCVCASGWAGTGAVRGEPGRVRAVPVRERRHVRGRGVLLHARVQPDIDECPSSPCTIGATATCSDSTNACNCETEQNGHNGQNSSASFSACNCETDTNECVCTRLPERRHVHAGRRLVHVHAGYVRATWTRLWAHASLSWTSARRCRA